MRENGIELLNTLGYRSERQVELEPNTFDGLVDIHPPFSEINHDKAMVNDWISVDVLFQLTGEDIKHISQGHFIFEDVQTFNNQIIESYLFLAIELTKGEYPRSKLADLTREVNKFSAMPVMILFKHGSTLTLSIINRRLSKRDASKDVLEKVTLIKGIHIANPIRAHIEILFDLSLHQLQKDAQFQNFVELHHAWQKTLDTSELNKKFYREIANWYFWAVKNVEFPVGTIPDEETRNATNVIRLITRLIFVWFIKEKGLVPDDLFDQRKLQNILNYEDPKNSTYYKAILQNLFFATLNTEMGEGRRFRGKNKNPNGLDSHYGITTVYRYEKYFKNPQEALELFAGIPFLNGGLFECLDKREEGLLVDGFSDGPRNQPVVPDELFFGVQREVDLSSAYGDSRRSHEKVRGLIDILVSYKFTIEENTPIEEEIALDPELLGKVFENLLAAYNPETGTTARKQTGSFYTPREIVNYMVDESLIAYLEDKLEGAPDLQPRLRLLLAYNQEPNQFTTEETDRLIKAIDGIKVLDPACGSGAFPMGVLHKLVFILNKLDPQNQKWQELQLQKAIIETEEAFQIGDQEERRQRLLDIDETFENNTSDYGRKLHLIENCIYGVDIQPIAVQIAKLRFFISLIVDQMTDRSKLNLGIRPLPNLETKFVAANTLIGIERPQQMMLRNPWIEDKEKRLADVRSSLFTARTPATKLKYREMDRQLRTELADLLRGDGWGRTTAAQLASWDPYDQNTSAGFYDPDWMFGVTDGFNIILGNPPYLESRHPAFSENLKNAYQDSVKRRWHDDARYISKGADLLIYFFEHSIFHITNNGCIVLITQNSWLDTEYGKKFQKFLLKHTNVSKIVDSDFRYFPSGEGPNINAVITIFIGKTPTSNNIVTFARYHENFQQIDLASLNLSGNLDTNIVSIQQYSYSTEMLRDIKWGVLLSASTEILSLLNLLNDKAKKLSDVKTARLSYGQGLNLSKDYIVPRRVLDEMQITENAAIPILTAVDGAVFDIASTAQVILDKTKLSHQEITRLKTNETSIFDPAITNKKPPKLIMPRGIGRHYCALNSIGSYSSSGVDVYDYTDAAPNELILNLWLFFNSSIAWLLREVFGRKNLGGGMLKAEAIDLETMPVYMEFNKYQEIAAIFSKIRTRQALPSIEEVNTAEHQEIDTIVMEYLGLADEQRRNIVSMLQAKISDREKKSTRSVTQNDPSTNIYLTHDKPENVLDEIDDDKSLNRTHNQVDNPISPLISDTRPANEEALCEVTPTLGDYGLYKCSLCGRLVIGFLKDEHAMEQHRGKAVEWKKVR